MGIFNRIGRLWKADVHGIIDSLEEPRRILKQALRDMQDEIEESTGRLEAIRSEEERMSKRRSRVNESLDDTVKQIEVAFGAEDLKLARTFVRKRLELERMVSHLEIRLAEIAATKSTAEQTLSGQREQYQRVAEKAEILCEAESRRECNSSSVGDELFVSENDVEVAMLEERNRRESGRTEQIKNQAI